MHILTSHLQVNGVRQTIAITSRVNQEMSSRCSNERLLSILYWLLKLQHWQSTHAIKDDSGPTMKCQMSMDLSSECCVCFEARAPQRDPCVHCGGSFPVCERCLHAWSWAAGSVKRCVICRSEALRPSRERRAIDLHLHPLSPLSFLFMISMYVLVHYSWLRYCYRIVTSPSHLF